MLKVKWVNLVSLAAIFLMLAACGGVGDSSSSSSDNSSSTSSVSSSVSSSVGSSSSSAASSTSSSSSSSSSTSSSSSSSLSSSSASSSSSSTSISIVYTFGANSTDALYPRAALVQGNDGNFYGTTLEGGDNNTGAIFKLTPAGVETILHSFPAGTGGLGSTDGIMPQSSLIQASDGDFYGTAPEGGTYSCGIIFKITASGDYTVLHHFKNLFSGDGCMPLAQLVQGTDGNFYGATASGGLYTYQGELYNTGGTIFKMSPAGVVTVLYNFDPYLGDGSSPRTGLTQANDGSFYGTTENDSVSEGAVFKLSANGTVTTLYSFGTTSGDGYDSRGTLVQATDGDLYGTTYEGGTNNRGTVFKITLGGVYSLLYSFGAGGLAGNIWNDGVNPEGSLVQGKDGNLYGTTYGGSPNSDGTIFKITTSGVETILYTFGSQYVNSDGFLPEAGLIQASDGNFYGVTGQGGATSYSGGTVFKYAP